MDGCSGAWGAISTVVNLSSCQVESSHPSTDGVGSIQPLIGRYLVLVGMLWGAGDVHSARMCEARPGDGWGSSWSVDKK